jgi:hypothetical protein
MKIIMCIKIYVNLLALHFLVISYLFSVLVVFCHAGGIFLFCCLNRGFEGLMDCADFFGFLVWGSSVSAHAKRVRKRGGLCLAGAEIDTDCYI